MLRPIKLHFSIHVLFCFFCPKAGLLTKKEKKKKKLKSINSYTSPIRAESKFPLLDYQLTLIHYFQPKECGRFVLPCLLMLAWKGDTVYGSLCSSLDPSHHFVSMESHMERQHVNVLDKSPDKVLINSSISSQLYE